MANFDMGKFLSSLKSPVPDEEDNDSPFRFHQFSHLEFFNNAIVPQEEQGDLETCRNMFNFMVTAVSSLSTWLSYIDFELRHGGVDRARKIFEVLVETRPDPISWLCYAEFEFTYGSRVGLGICKDRVMMNLDLLKKNDEEGLKELLLAFAEFEEQLKELESATRVYESALETCVGCSKDLYKKIVEFEQRHSGKNRVVKRVLQNRRDYFESLVMKNPWNHKAWWGYIRMVEDTSGDMICVRSLYHRALKNVPRIEEKSIWKKYVYLWILYAFFEEIDMGDIGRARQAYMDCIKVIPHAKFSFSKIWLFAASFEIKQLEVKNMRKILDGAIRIVPTKRKILKKYLEIELQLENVQQIRKLYMKLVQDSPDDSHEEWVQSAQYENSLNTPERARFVFERAVLQPALQNSKYLWKAYTDFETSVGEIERTRDLHNKVLTKKNHLNVFLSLAKFEAYGVQKIRRQRERHEDDYDTSIESSCLEEARKVFHKALKSYGCFEEEDYRYRVSAETEKNQMEIVKEWVKVERKFGELGDCEMVYNKLPWKLKQRLMLDDDDGMLKGGNRWRNPFQGGHHLLNRFPAGRYGGHRALNRSNWSGH